MTNTNRDIADAAAAVEARRQRIADGYSNGPVRDVTAMVQAAAAVAEKPEATAADVAAAVHGMRAMVQDIACRRRRRAEQQVRRHHSASHRRIPTGMMSREIVAVESWRAAEEMAQTAFGPLAPLNARHGVTPTVDQLIDQLCRAAGMVAG